MSEKKLIANIQKGEISSLEELVHTYYNDIYYYLYRKLGNSADAQDLTQDVFVKFFSNIHSYKEHGKLRNYLFKLAFNTSNDLFRKSKNYFQTDEISDIADSTLNPMEIMQKKEEQEAVKNALELLPAFQRDVIILRFYHELPFGDIAKITNSSVSTTKSRYRQGMAKIKEILEVNFHER